MRWVSAAVFVAIFFAFAMVPWPWHVFDGIDYALGMATLVFSLDCPFLAKERASNQSDRYGLAALAWLAASSYSLYLVHYPFLAFMSVLVGAQGRWAPVPRYLAAGAGFCAAVVLYSFGVAACTEWNNDKVRRWVEKRLSSRARVRKAAPARL